MDGCSEELRCLMKEIKMQEKETGNSSSADTTAGASGLLAKMKIGGLTITKEGLEKAKAKVRAEIGPRPQHVIRADKAVLLFGKEIKTLITDIDAKKAEKDARISEKHYSMLPAIDSEMEELEGFMERMKKSRNENLKVIQEYNLSMLKKFDLPAAIQRLNARIEESISSSRKVVELVEQFTPTPLDDEKFEDFC